MHDMRERHMPTIDKIL